MILIRNKFKRAQPILLQAIPRLIARLAPEHQKTIFLKDILYRVGAGYSGECNVDSYIERTQFPPLTKIFYDVHLHISPTLTFQIDTLIITERYLLVMEVKNLKDTVRFVQNPLHLEQILETGDEAVIDCPVYQLEANKANLTDWFLQRGIHMKTNGLLVLANPNIKVKDAPLMTSALFIRSNFLFTCKIFSLSAETSHQKKFKTLQEKYILNSSNSIHFLFVLIIMSIQMIYGQAYYVNIAMKIFCQKTGKLGVARVVKVLLVTLTTKVSRIGLCLSKTQSTMENVVNF